MLEECGKETNWQTANGKQRRRHFYCPKFTTCTFSGPKKSTVLPTCLQDITVQLGKTACMFSFPKLKITLKFRFRTAFKFWQNGRCTERNFRLLWLNLHLALSYCLYFCMRVLCLLKVSLRISNLSELAFTTHCVYVCLCVCWSCALLSSLENSWCTEQPGKCSRGSSRYYWLNILRGEITFTGFLPFFLFLLPSRSGAGLCGQTRQSCREVSVSCTPPTLRGPQTICIHHQGNIASFKQ